MDGATDVQSGRISTGSPGGDGGRDEHPGDCADVWPAHGAVADLLTHRTTEDPRGLSAALGEIGGTVCSRSAISGRAAAVARH